MRFFLRKVNKLNRGFTLVETLVAISIFTSSIIVLMSVLSQGISNTTYARNKMIASYMAQEGIEYIRNMRDTYTLYYDIDPAKGWNKFTTNMSPCGSANGCNFDDSLSSFDITSLQGMNIHQCTGNNCSLFYDSTNGAYTYNHSTGIDSGFTRTIKIDKTGLDPSNEMKIISIVSWTQGSGSYKIEFSENLFNWVE